VPFAVGETFERYEIESLIGRGGMGEVYRAIDTRLRRKVALKMLRPDRENAEAVARLFREARAAAMLTHPNTVAIHDIGEAAGIFYIVMELVTGAPLLAYVGDERVPAARKLSWLVDVARALSAAHKAGLVHRDVKPSNVMVSDEGIVKVLDFGLARPLAPPVSFRTQQGHVLGTPRYMAPEQLAGREVDARTDQYAFALTAYELVAGRHPGGALAGSIVPPRLDQVVPTMSRAVGDVIARAMANKPDQRYETMAEVVTALEDAIAGRPARCEVLPPARSGAADGERDGGAITALDLSDAAAEARAAIGDAKRLDSTPPTVAAPTRRAGGAGLDILVSLPDGDTNRPPKTLPAAGAPAEIDASASESDVPTASARTLATEIDAPASTPAAPPPSPQDLGRTMPLAAADRAAPCATPPKAGAAAPILRTLMSREPEAPLPKMPPVALPHEEVLRGDQAGAAASGVAPGPRALRDDAEAKRPATAPTPRRWPALGLAIVVMGLCAFAGAYFGAKRFAAGPSAPAPPTAPASSSAPATAPSAASPAAPEPPVRRDEPPVSNKVR
jgi:hypothetical protein